MREFISQWTTPLNSLSHILTQPLAQIIINYKANSSLITFYKVHVTEQGSSSLATVCVCAWERETEDIFSTEVLFLAIDVLVGHTIACVCVSTDSVQARNSKQLQKNSNLCRQYYL